MLLRWLYAGRIAAATTTLKEIHMKKQLAVMAMIGAFSLGAHAQIKAGGGDGDDKSGPANTTATTAPAVNSMGQSKAGKVSDRKQKRAADQGAKMPSSGGDGDDKSGPGNTSNSTARAA